MFSPRLPVRPSTLMRCCRKVVKAEGSKMRSCVGCAALMMNCRGGRGQRGQTGSASVGQCPGTFWVILWPFLPDAALLGRLPPVELFCVWIQLPTSLPPTAHLVGAETASEGVGGQQSEGHTVAGDILGDDWSSGGAKKWLSCVLVDGSRKRGDVASRKLPVNQKSWLLALDASGFDDVPATQRLRTAAAEVCAGR